MSANSTWWTLCLATGMRVYLPAGDGELLRQACATRHQKDSDDQLMFVEVEDVSGAPFVIRVDQIESLYLCTPALREQDHDPDGVLEEIRAWAQECSTKKWDEL